VEKIFGSFYDFSETEKRFNIPDNIDYLRENRIYSYDSKEAGSWRDLFSQKIESGQNVYLLGFHALTHDSSISLIEASKQNGITILANIEEERFNGKKHFAGYPEHSVYELKKMLKLIGISSSDIFCVLYAFEIAEAEKDRLESVFLQKKIITPEFAYLQQVGMLGSHSDSEKLEKKNFSSMAPSMVKAFHRLRSDLGLEDTIPCIQMGHHENHAYFAYGVSPFAKHGGDDLPTMISCIDGAGERASCSLYRADGSKIERIKTILNKDSLGAFYALFASFLGGWSPLSAEGRYMGAAAWGNGNRLTNPYYKRLRQYFYFAREGQVYTNSEMTANHSALIHDIVGPFLDKERLWNPDAVLNVDDITHSSLTRDRVDKAAAVQMVFEDALFHIMAYLIEETGSDKLVMCGGTALNCVANMRLLEHFNRDYYLRYLGRNTQLHLWVPPIPSDQGVALGSAYQFAMRNGVKPGDGLPTPFLCGLPPSDEELRRVLDSSDFIFYEERGNLNDSHCLKDMADLMAFIVSRDGIIGIYQGEAETGPRALGHRSILANPCNPKTLAMINSRVKLREKIRPLAPMVTLDEAPRWFDLSEGASENAYDAYNYMVLTAQVTEEAKVAIPAVIHHDNTSRIQIVRPENNLLIFTYLKALKKYLGVEVSVNTSLNVGSPMVQTPAQALEIFKRAKGLDGIVMVSDTGHVYVVWAKEGVQIFESRLPGLIEEHRKQGQAFYEEKERVLQALKENKITLPEARHQLKFMINKSPVEPQLKRGKEASQGKRPDTVSQRDDRRFEPIAIIGMSGKFPDADDVDALWENLKQGRCSIGPLPGDRGWPKDEDLNPKAHASGATYAKVGGFLKDIDMFDPAFFKMISRDAEYMDPNGRLFLQEAWKAIEDAGYTPAEIDGEKWGIFACTKGDYYAVIQHMDPSFITVTDSNAISKLAYLLNLTGPAMEIDTACSSSLATIAYVCDSLNAGNCEVAIAGGGNVLSTPYPLINSGRLGLLSPDGQCRSFDRSANGMVMGEAIGVVILKTLKHAVRDGDRIHGVIKGWGTNQDAKTGAMFALSKQSQIELQQGIYEKFHIHPEHITMVESHGTGTRLGDAIEFEALTESFRKFTGNTRYCALGSLKSNIGHAFSGAGIASLIKVLLSIKHKSIPASLNFESNPDLNDESSPFFINTVLKKWESDVPRLAAINCFGATGTKVHLVIEEYQPWDVSLPCDGDAKPGRISLPTYPFQKRRCWIEVPDRVAMGERLSAVKKDITDIACLSEEAESYKAAHSPVEHALIKIWMDIFGIPEVNRHANFFQLGGDSLKVVKLVSKIEKQFGLTLPFQSIYQFPTLAELSEIISSDQEDPTALLIESYQRKSQTPIFWILGSFETQNMPLVFMQLFFHKERGRKIGMSVEEMAAEIVKQIGESQNNDTYYLCGFSTGALIALETARQLKNSGKAVPWLFLLDPLDADLSDDPIIEPEPVVMRTKRHCQQLMRLNIVGKYRYLKKRQSVSLKPYLKRVGFLLCSKLNIPWRFFSQSYFTHKFYKEALLQYEYREYYGQVKIIMGKPNYEVRKMKWQQICPDADIKKVDCINHGSMIDYPLNNQWIPELTNLYLSGTKNYKQI